MKRLGFFSFYEKNGQVKDHIPYLLEGLLPHLSELWIIVNGTLSEEGRSILERYTEHILVRENRDFDVGAYRAGMAHLGREKLLTFDETVLFNDTILGPVYPFEEMFLGMQARTLDFWGITRCRMAAEPQVREAQEDGKEDEKAPAYVQGAFLVLRRSLVKAEAFQTYWDTLPQFQTYAAVQAEHEAVFTKHFSDLGFRWDTYIHDEALLKQHPKPFLTCTYRLVEKYRCPVFPRQIFFRDYAETISAGAGQEAASLLRFLTRKTEYPVEALYEALIGTQNLYALSMQYHWNRILPADEDERMLRRKKAAFVVLTKEPALSEEVRALTRNLPPDVKLISLSEGDYTEGLREVLSAAERFDIVGFFHDLPVSSSLHRTVDEGTFFKCAASLLPSYSYVKRLLKCFEEDETLGLLAVPPMNHGIYGDMPGAPWRDYYPEAAAWHRRLEMTVPLSFSIPPVMVPELMFVASKGALLSVKEPLERILSEKKPAEEIPGDTPYLKQLHDRTYGLLERFLPYLCQEGGYHTETVTSAWFAAVELDNLRFRAGAEYRHARHLTETGIEEALSSHEEAARTAERDRVIAFYESTLSWRLTKPFRAVKNGLLRLFGGTVRTPYEDDGTKAADAIEAAGEVGITAQDPDGAKKGESK